MKYLFMIRNLPFPLYISNPQWQYTNLTKIFSLNSSELSTKKTRSSFKYFIIQTPLFFLMQKVSVLSDIGKLIKLLQMGQCLAVFF